MALSFVRRHRLLLLLPATEFVLSEGANCDLKELSLKGVRSWVAFTSKFDDEDEPQPLLLKDVANTWPLYNWTLDDLTSQLGELRVWPRDLRSADPAYGPRTNSSTLAEFLLSGEEHKVVHEASFTSLSSKLEPAYKIPRAFKSYLRSAPVVSLARRGAGLGLHRPLGHFGSWIGQAKGSSTILILPPGSTVKETWFWTKGGLQDKLPKKLLACALDAGDAVFVPRGFYHALRAESEVSLQVGWHGETRSTGELEPALTAISDGDPDALLKAASEFPEGPDRKMYMTPCVNHAMLTGHIAILKTLQRLGASLDEETPTGGTYLHQAAAFGQAEGVRYALQDGADPSVKHSKDGGTPVHSAAQFGHSEVMQVFLSKAKTSWKNKDSRGRQAMHVAAAGGHTAVIDTLLKYGAKVDVGDRAKFQPIHWAVEENHSEAVNFLLSHGAKLEAKTKDGETALYRAAVKGHKSILLALLDARANVEVARPNGGQMPVHAAAYVGHMEILKALHACGANMTAAAGGRQTPEDLAAAAGNSQVLDYLREIKEKRVDLTAQDTNMYAAVQAGHVAMVGRLLDKEITMGPPQERKYKLSLMAAESGHTAVMDFLLDGGSLLKERRAGGTTLLQAAIRRGKSEVLDYLLKLDTVNASFADEAGDTPTMLAAALGHADAVSKLGKAGADLSSRNSQGASALHYAVMKGHSSVVKSLLDHGADMMAEGGDVIGTANETGRQHVHVAAAAGHRAVLRTLLEHRADTMAEDRRGLNPAHLAAEHGHVDILKLLAESGADLHHRVLAKFKKPPKKSNESSGEGDESSEGSEDEESAEVEDDEEEEEGADADSGQEKTEEESKSSSGSSGSSGSSNSNTNNNEKKKDKEEGEKEDDAAAGGEDGDIVEMEASVLGIAGAQGHIAVLQYMLQDAGVARSKRIIESFGKKHGPDWQRKAERTLRLNEKEESDKKMREAMADPETRKRMEEFNKMYAGLSPKERKAMDAQIANNLEQERAKKQFEEQEAKRRVRKGAEL